MAVSATILSPAVCVCNTLSKESLCNRKVHYMMSQPFFSSSLVQGEPKLHPEELKCERNNTLGERLQFRY